MLPTYYYKEYCDIVSHNVDIDVGGQTECEKFHTFFFSTLPLVSSSCEMLADLEIKGQQHSQPGPVLTLHPHSRHWTDNWNWTENCCKVLIITFI